MEWKVIDEDEDFKPVTISITCMSNNELKVCLRKVTTTIGDMKYDYNSWGDLGARLSRLIDRGN